MGHPALGFKRTQSFLFYKHIVFLLARKHFYKLFFLFLGQMSEEDLDNKLSKLTLFEIFLLLFKEWCQTKFSWLGFGKHGLPIILLIVK